VFDVNATGKAGPRPVPDPRFPGRLASWLARRRAVVAVIAQLRRAGTDPDAVAALLALPDVERLRVSWERWLAEVGDPVAAARELRRHLPLGVPREAIYALWGAELRYENVRDGNVIEIIPKIGSTRDPYK